MQIDYELTSEYFDQHGNSLYNLCKHPTLLVFLRHQGCTFCRETVSELKEHEELFETTGIKIAFVTMSPEQKAQPFFAEYGFEEASRFSDSSQRLYAAFNLKKGGVSELFSPEVLLRGLKAGLLDNHGLGKPEADVSQLPGTFLISDFRIIEAFRAKIASDKADYSSMACALV